jgi:hypothetical protein
MLHKAIPVFASAAATSEAALPALGNTLTDLSQPRKTVSDGGWIHSVLIP